MEELKLLCDGDEISFSLKPIDDTLYGEIATKKVAMWCRDNKKCILHFRDFEAEVRLDRFGFNWVFEIGDFRIVINAGVHGKTSVLITGGDIGAE